MIKAQHAAPASAGAPQSRPIYGIQMLRAVAAIAVVGHHALEASDGAPGRFSPDWFTTACAAGVDIFFVISGFIMVYVSFRPGRPPTRPGSFLFHRFTRIYPFYWLCCLGTLSIAAAGFLRSQHWTVTEVLLDLALLPSSRLLVDAAWTLVHEVRFYLIFALLLATGVRAIVTYGSCLAIVAIVLLSQFLPPSPAQKYLSDPVSLDFCMGMLLALVHQRLALSRAAVVALMTAGFALLLVAPMFVYHPDTHMIPGWSRPVFWGLPSLLIVAASLSLKAPASALGRALVLLGDASYAIYLSHPFVVLAYARAIKEPAIGNLPQLPFVTVIMIVSIVLGLLAHIWAERPILAAIRRFTGRKPGGIHQP